MEFESRNINTYRDSDEGGPLHCNSYQIGLIWTLFVTLFGDGNDGWFSATFKTRITKILIENDIFIDILIFSSKSGEMVWCVVFVTSCYFYFDTSVGLFVMFEIFYCLRPIV